MKIQSFVKSVCLFSAAALVLIMHPAIAQDEVVTITGMVSAWEWDKEDNVTKVSITTDDEDIIVGNNSLGKELLNLVDHAVQATGVISANENEEKIILLSEYKDLGKAEIEDEDEESEPDDE